MEGAVLSGKLAAEVIACRAAGEPTQGLKAVQPDIESAAAAAQPRKPVGVKGSDPVSFGGGSSLGSKAIGELKEIDPSQLVPLG